MKNTDAGRIFAVLAVVLKDYVAGATGGQRNARLGMRFLLDKLRDSS
jgi:hypothetical protein